MSINGSRDDFVLVEHEDDFELVSRKEAVLKSGEYTSTQTATDEILTILSEYIKINYNKSSSWEREAYMQKTCFEGHIAYIEQEYQFGRRGPLTTFEVQDYVINKLADVFIDPIKKMLGLEGNSELRASLRKCALAWKIDPQEFPNVKKRDYKIKSP